MSFGRRRPALAGTLGLRDHPRPASVAVVVGMLGIVGVVGLWPQHIDKAVNVELMRVLTALAGQSATRWITYPVVESAANVALFMPLGLFLTRALGLERAWMAVVLSIAVSASIELAQLLALPGRSADPRDLIANSSGAVLGAVVGALTIRERSRRH